MICHSLNGSWLVRQYGTQDWLPASVPGCVTTDLMEAGRLPDPYVGLNEKDAWKSAEKDWEYRRFFHPPAALLAQDQVVLCCDGLDTLAEVSLNGQAVAETDNMHRAYRWDVRSLLRDGENELRVRFRSPLAAVREKQKRKRLPGTAAIPGGQYLRKAPSHFGWDWGPRLPLSGIWRGIRLEGHSRGRLVEVRYEQHHENGMVMLTAHVGSDVWDASGARYNLRLRITGPERTVWQADAPARPQQAIPIVITDPRLWWPNGMGEQPLYHAALDLIALDADQVEHLVDTRSLWIGLRTVRLLQPFSFMVNGRPMIVKGANWIPADAFPARVTQQQVEFLVQSAAAANHNMLRVWGGGYYESDAFYEECDRAGILVWQDTAFACGLYPLDDPAYAASVLAEAGDNARRLRHHACLALWCGGNEIDSLAEAMRWNRTHAGLIEASRRFFHQSLPDCLAEVDPGRAYWPGSPCSGDPLLPSNCESDGDSHLWDVFHAYRSPEHYRRQNPRFASEFGFQSLPEQQTLARFDGNGPLRLDSPEIAHRQRSPGGNEKLTWYLSRRFRLPGSLDGLVYLSQVFQAEALRLGVEHWRRHPETTTGMLFWQLNDCWPAISWSSIDYHGRWKALHYAARRFYSPVLLSLEESPRDRRVSVWLTNDTTQVWQGRLRWTLETLDGEVLEGGEQPITAAPSGAACLLKKDFSPAGSQPRRVKPVDWRRAVFVAELRQGDALTARQICLFGQEKDTPLTDPCLSASVVEVSGGQASLRVEAQRLARFVALRFEGADVVFSDNFFDLPAGRAAQVTCRLPDGWTTAQAAAALRAQSLFDAGPYHSPAAARLLAAAALAASLAKGAASLWNTRR